MHLVHYPLSIGLASYIVLHLVFPPAPRSTRIRRYGFAPMTKGLLMVALGLLGVQSLVDITAQIAILLVCGHDESP